MECKKCEHEYISVCDPDPGLCSECWHEEEGLVEVCIRNLMHSFPTLRHFIWECYLNSDMDKVWHLLENLETEARPC